jgi:hypothetical protein
MTSRRPTAFISYSWDSEPHKEWVKGLAEALRRRGVDITLDRWHLQPGDQLTRFMESAVRENDFILIVCTPGYRSRSDQRKGGVGYEGDIMTAEVYASANHRKFVPLLRQGEWRDAAPSWVSGKMYLDFCGEPYPASSFDLLLKTLYGTLDAAPPLGPAPDFNTAQADSDIVSESETGGLAESFDGCYRRARENLGALGARHYRRADLLSVTTLDIPVARLWQAASDAQGATAGAQASRCWPLVFHFFGQETKRNIYPWGFTAEFAQSADRGGSNYEYVAANESGSLRILETEGIQLPGNATFYYDRAIGTAVDALEFAARFFRNIGLGEANEISIRLEWGGLNGQHIGAERARMIGYEQCISQTDVVASEVRFSLADSANDMPARIETLLSKVFNQFGMFHPKAEIYERVIQAWKSGE